MDPKDIKARNLVEKVVGQYIQLNKIGKNYQACCPFHSEKTPSFTVFPDTQTIKCFGCGWHGDVIDFIKEIENVDFVRASEILGGESTQPPKNVAKSNSYLSEPPKPSQDTGYQVSAKAFVEARHSTLLSENSKARQWLNARGITDDMIKAHLIGFNAEFYEATWGEVTVKIPYGIVIPWFFQDNLTGIRIRQSQATPKYIWVKGGLGGKAIFICGDTSREFGITRDTTVVLTEGEFDGILLAHALREQDHIKIFSVGANTGGRNNASFNLLLGVSKAVGLAFDNDGKSEGAFEYWLHRSSLHNKVFRIDTPHGQDISDIWKANGGEEGGNDAILQWIMPYLDLETQKKDDSDSGNAQPLSIESKSISSNCDENASSTTPSPTSVPKNKESSSDNSNSESESKNENTSTENKQKLISLLEEKKQDIERIFRIRDAVSAHTVNELSDEDSEYCKTMMQQSQYMLSGMAKSILRENSLTFKLHELLENSSLDEIKQHTEIRALAIKNGWMTEEQLSPEGTISPNDVLKLLRLPMINAQTNWLLKTLKKASDSNTLDELDSLILHAALEEGLLVYAPLSILAGVHVEHAKLTLEVLNFVKENPLEALPPQLAFFVERKGWIELDASIERRVLFNAAPIEHTLSDAKKLLLIEEAIEKDALDTLSPKLKKYGEEEGILPYQRYSRNVQVLIDGAELALTLYKALRWGMKFEQLPQNIRALAIELNWVKEEQEIDYPELIKSLENLAQEAKTILRIRDAMLTNTVDKLTESDRKKGEKLQFLPYYQIAPYVQEAFEQARRTVLFVNILKWGPDNLPQSFKDFVTEYKQNQKEQQEAESKEDSLLAFAVNELGMVLESEDLEGVSQNLDKN